ncbi:MAG: YqhA family protein [Spirochaetota bacterium]
MSDEGGKKRKIDFLANDERRNFLVERLFERGLWSTRFFVLFAVVSSFVASLTLFVMGSLEVAKVFAGFVTSLTGSNHSDAGEEAVIGAIIGSVDIFLIAVVLLIFSFGLYELFISHINAADTTESSNILDIESLDVLKDKIGQVIIMALIVKFFQVILTMKPSTISDMLLLAGAIALLSLALFLMQLGKKLLHGDD